MKKHTPEQIIRKLRESEAELAQGATIAVVCQKLGMSEQTFHRWRNQYGGLKSNDAKRLKDLEHENEGLRRTVAQLTLDKQMLQDVVEKKMVSAEGRRQRVRDLQDTYEVSQRRACALLNQPRATQRQRPRAVSELQRQWETRMLELVGKHPRYGYRRIWALLRHEGWRVNRKRVYRLWRHNGLKVPQKPRKKQRLGSSSKWLRSSSLRG